MDYFDYINSLEPSPELKEKSKQSVQSALIQKNRIIKQRKAFILSTAACFILLAISITYYGYMHQDKDLILDKPDASETNNTANSTYNDEKIIVNVKGNVNISFGALDIIISDNIYVQVCDNTKMNLGEDNGYITILMSDLGEEVCTLNENNMGELDISTGDFTKLSIEEAKKNKFYNAKIYKYTKCKNDTVLLAKTSDEFYMFKLDGFVPKKSASDISFSDILDIYTASGYNGISCIEISRSEHKTTTFKDENNELITEKREVRTQIDTITNKNSIENIINTFKSTTENYNDNDNDIWNRIDNGSEDESVYLITIIFEDETKLYIDLVDRYYKVLISLKDNYGYYLLSQKNYDYLISLIDTQ